MNRNSRAKMGDETVKIVDRGWYETSDGHRVEIAHQIDACLNATQLYAPTQLNNLPMNNLVATGNTLFEVENETTLSAARRAVVENGNAKTLCLNFASAKNPGGGFLKGSQAQEESLARSSALYASLLTQDDFYKTNRGCRTALYTDHLILSPNVPVFRHDDGNLLRAPYLLSILTSPAVNAGAVKKNEPDKEPMIRPTMANRITKILQVSAHHGYDHLILGAWGCGVFGNDPDEIAELFAEALLGGNQFDKKFSKVTFAVLDRTDDEQVLTPFRKRFGSNTSTL